MLLGDEENADMPDASFGYDMSERTLVVGVAIVRPLVASLKLPRFRRVVLDLGDYGSVVTASIAAS
jgi:hypothetical protein